MGYFLIVFIEFLFVYNIERFTPYEKKNETTFVSFFIFMEGKHMKRDLSIVSFLLIYFFEWVDVK